MPRFVPNDPSRKREMESDWRRYTEYLARTNPTELTRLKRLVSQWRTDDRPGVDLLYREALGLKPHTFEALRQYTAKTEPHGKQWDPPPQPGKEHVLQTVRDRSHEREL